MIAYYRRFKAIRARDKDRQQQRRDREQYQTGFGWAMSAFFIECLTLADIEIQIYGETSPYDRGADSALTFLQDAMDRIPATPDKKRREELLRAQVRHIHYF